MQDADRSPDAEELRDIYQQLKKGLGHDRVNDGNVFALIELASQYGHTQIEQLLREWQSPCSDGSDGVPSTIPPTPGFNRENVKH
ncbi:hypothetical protein OOT46_19165 [Aquabacterium sp. A7-Y]|uniref:hypothetical protein n=1 Tax=Aquabacterium sp. A7-Y TaxID=1349605 RepID=UPI00223E423D|nr:hypothetical protein [Aquabacterium sp. A7-Y]MCW7539960.1 hypothetical protein [Aquabacterium sp. A7-Y]